MVYDLRAVCQCRWASGRCDVEDQMLKTWPLQIRCKHKRQRKKKTKNHVLNAVKCKCGPS
jgi:hypothetical protein